MSLLEQMKLVLRVTSPEFDPEVQMHVEAALADMRRVGVKEELIEQESPLVVQAVACFVKARFGFDNEDAPRFEQSYRQTVADLLNSDANAAAVGE